MNTLRTKKLPIFLTTIITSICLILCFFIPKVFADNVSEDTTQTVLSVPTSVPCSVLADGTVITPTNWSIKNLTTNKVTISNIQVEKVNNFDCYPNLSLNLGNTNVLTYSPNGSTSIKNFDFNANETVSGSWTVGDIKNTSFDLTSSVAIYSIKFTYTPLQKTFAVYSSDDKSLSFYSRNDSVPNEGTTYNGKTATAVYTDISSSDGFNIPWSDIADRVVTISAVDTITLPESIESWFSNFSSLTTVDFSKTITKKTKLISNLFDSCSSLKQLDISGWDTSNLDTNLADRWLGANSHINILKVGEGWTGSLNSTLGFNNTWYDSNGKSYLYSNIPAGVENTYYANEGDIPKTAFAVYSADDQSLNFYKRTTVPNAGETFEGKTVTEVYTEIENTGTSIPAWITNHQDDIKSVRVVDKDIKPKSTRNWFRALQKITSCDLLNLDTSQVTNMSFMFVGCSSLTNLDLSNFDTSQVTNMNNMFAGCSSLTNLDLSNFNINQVTYMSHMFHSCSSLTNLDLSNFDTSQVTDMSYMFHSCSSLTNLDLSNFDTSQVTNMSFMFDGCSSLTSLDLSNFDTSQVTNMSFMFYDCSYLQQITFGANWNWVGTNGYLRAPDSTYISGADGKWYDTDGNGYTPVDIPSNKAMTYTAVPPKPKTAFAVYSADDQSLNFYKRATVPNAGETFESKTVTEVYTEIENKGATIPAWIKNHKNEIKSAKVVDKDIKPKSTFNWFRFLQKMTSCDLLNLDTSQVTSMGYMFNGCTSLTNLDLSNFDTNQVTYMNSMFNGCTSLTNLDLSNFDTSQVTNMDQLFNGCSSLTSLDLSNFDTSQVTFKYMHAMFDGCSHLQQITFGANWNWVTTGGYLPAPDSTYISGADGKWYDTSGTAYAPNEIPSNTAMTYFASKNLVPAIEEKAFAD